MHCYNTPCLFRPFALLTRISCICLSRHLILSLMPHLPLPPRSRSCIASSHLLSHASSYSHPHSRIYSLTASLDPVHLNVVLAHLALARLPHSLHIIPLLPIASISPGLSLVSIQCRSSGSGIQRRRSHIPSSGFWSLYPRQAWITRRRLPKYCSVSWITDLFTASTPF